MKKSLRTVLSLFLFLLAGSIGAQEPAKLRVKVFPGAQNLPLFAGIAKGFFAKRGITVDLLSTANSTELRDGLANGDIEVAHAAVDNAVAMVRTQAAPLAHRRHDLQENVKQLQATLDDELLHLRESRDEIAATLTGSLRTRYDAALTRAGVSGAAVVDGNRCDGCRVGLSPLDVDRTRAAAATDPLDCPHCGRLLLC